MIQKENYKIIAAAPMSALVDITSDQLLPANDERSSVLIVNLSTGNVSLAFGTHAAVLDAGVTLQPGDVFYMADRDIVEHTINIIAEIAASPVSVQEWSIQ